MANPILSGLQAAAKAAKAAKAAERVVPKIAAPQDEALRLAQQRAALPVKKGGLGLPADNTPQQRAAAMGAEFGWGHGSNNPNITTFKPSRTGAQGPGIYATNYLPETNMYSSLKDTGGTSYPLAVFRNEALVSKLNNPYDELKVAADDELISELFKRNKSAIITNQEPTPDWLLKQGVTEYPERQHYVSVNPDNFRSRFAAFDPFRRNAATAAALGVAAPDLLAKEKAKGGEVSQDAMRMALSANKVQHKGVGGIAKLVANSAKAVVPKLPKGQQAVLSAAESAANLKRFLAESGEKRRMYHGSKEPNITEFKTRKDMTDESNMTGHYADERDAVFLSPEPQFTTNFSQMGYTDTHQAPTTYPVWVQAKKPFDFDNPAHLKQVKETYLDMYHNPESDLYDPYLLGSERSMDQHSFNKRVDSLAGDENNWVKIENQKFQDVLKDIGFDSFYTRERGSKNLGVYDPSSIKSALGNRGTYDLAEPDMNKAKGGEVSQDAMRMALWKHPVKREAGGEAEPTPEERQVYRPISKRPRGTFDTSGAKALGTMLSGLGAAIPAGYAGLVELARTRDPKMAAEATEDLQRRYMALPTDQKTGDKVEGMAKFLEPLSKPAQYMGEKALGLFGPEVATATEVFLDPLNALPLIGKVPAAAKAVGRTLGPTADKMVMELMQKQGLAPGVVPKEADMSGWMSGSGRSIEEAQRLFEIAQGTRAKAAQEAAGLYHPIGGGNKLSKPIEMMNFKTVKDPTVTGVDRKIITPEDMYGGVAIPFAGDRAAGGKLLTEVEGKQFNKPLTLEAGPDYMLTHTIPGSPESSIWRSGKGVITGLKNQVDFANSMNRPIYGVNIVGAPTNVNYNTMVTEAILNQYDPTKITKKAKKEFLKDIRNYAPDAGKPHLKPGSVLTEADLNDVEALREKMLATGAGPLRKVFVERLGQAPFQAAGFPDVPASRLATTEPLLVDVPTGSSGFTIGKVDPAGRVLEQTPRGHKTYPTSLGGEYYGSLAAPMDFRDIFQGFADKRRTFGKPKESDLRSFSLAPQIQTLDQEWLDRAMKATGANKPREWKKGGVIKAAEGGEITSDDLIVDERPL